MRANKNGDKEREGENKRVRYERKRLSEPKEKKR